MLTISADHKAARNMSAAGRRGKTRVHSIESSPSPQALDAVLSLSGRSRLAGASGR